MRFVVALLLVIVTSCSSNSGVVPIGPDTYMVSRQAATGFTGSGTLKADAFREAHEYCTGLSKVMQVVRTEESRPPYIMTNFPKAEVQFMCLDPDDPDLERPKLKKEPDALIEVN